MKKRKKEMNRLQKEVLITSISNASDDEPQVSRVGYPRSGFKFFPEGFARVRSPT